MDIYFWCKLTGWSPVTCLVVEMIIITAGVLLCTGLTIGLVMLFMQLIEKRGDKDDSENN